MPELNPEELKDTLTRLRARWKASQEPAVEHALGYVPGPTEQSLEIREMLANSSYQQFKAMGAR